MSDKVYGGTPNGNVSLCATCRRAFIIRGTNLQEVVICRGVEPSLRVDFPVAQCRTYDDKRTPDIGSMKEIAWEIHSRKRGPVGFAGNTDELITIEPPSRYGDKMPEKVGERHAAQKESGDEQRTDL